MNFDYNFVRSKTACLALAASLRDQAFALELQAKRLDETRNYIPLQKDDYLPMVKIAKAIFFHPLYPEKKDKVIINLASRYMVDVDQLRIVYEHERRRRAAENRENITRTVRIMASKGKKSAEIARAVNRSPSRVSQILRSLTKSRLRRL